MADNATIDAMEQGEIAGTSGASNGTPEPKSILSTSNSGLSTNSRTWILGRSFTRSSATIRSLWSRPVQHSGDSDGKLVGDREPIIRSIHQGPRGYPRLATFLDSDENFMIYRRFGFLQSRLILEKQDSLRVLERHLELLDIEETHGDGNEYNLCSRESDDEALAIRRNELMKKIDVTFRDYVQLLQAAQAMVSFNKPTESEYVSVENFIHNGKPLVQKEGSFIYRKEDLVTLRPGREYALLDSFVERLLRYMKCSFVQWLFCSDETRKKSEKPKDSVDSDRLEVYYTRQRIEGLVVLIMTFMILILLIIPVYLLYHLTRGPETTRITAICIGVLLISTLLFAAGISLFTKAKRHEILVAAAGYSAVLVVFLGNVGNYGNGPGTLPASG